MSDLLARLYPDHLATLRQRADAALARGGFDHLVVAAGFPPYQFLDDRPFPFAVNPHFKHWLPVTKAPGSWLLYTPGQKPKLIYLQPHALEPRLVVARQPPAGVATLSHVTLPLADRGVMRVQLDIGWLRDRADVEEGEERAVDHSTMGDDHDCLAVVLARDAVQRRCDAQNELRPVLTTRSKRAERLPAEVRQTMRLDHVVP